jgi:hypothetical protein
MSSSGVDVMQKKPDETPIIWREYEALRDHLERIITRTTDTIDSDIQAVQMKVETTDATVNTMQVQVNDLQTSIQALTQSVNALRLSVEQRPLPYADADDESAHGDNEDFAAAGRGNGRGNGHPVRGRGFIPLGAQRVPFQQDDGLGKPKFSIPKFEGGTDVEEYLSRELKIEKLWHLHDYTEDKKIKLASSEFDGYALRWWDSVVHTRQENNKLPIMTWRHMKEVMRARFVPHNYFC